MQHKPPIGTSDYADETRTDHSQFPLPYTLFRSGLTTPLIDLVPVRFKYSLNVPILARPISAEKKANNLAHIGPLVRLES